MEKIIEFIINVFPLTMGIAISPMPLAGFIMIITSKKSKMNSIFYLLGWFISILVLLILGFAFYSNINLNDNSSALKFSLFNIFLGIGLLIFGLYSIIKGVSKNRSVKTPKWLQKIHDFSFFQSFLLAFTLMLINFKNFFITLDIGEKLLNINSSVVENIIIILIVAILSSSSVILFTLIFIRFKKKLTPKIEYFENWLINNNKLIIGILFSFLGMQIVLKNL